jgi:hypothetical protein
MAIRGLDLGSIAERAGLSAPTVSSAVRGRAINVRSALAISQAIELAPVIAAMETLVDTATFMEGGV